MDLIFIEDLLNNFAKDKITNVSQLKKGDKLLIVYDNNNIVMVGETYRCAVVDYINYDETEYFCENYTYSANDGYLYTLRDDFTESNLVQFLCDNKNKEDSVKFVTHVNKESNCYAITSDQSRMDCIMLYDNEAEWQKI